MDKEKITEEFTEQVADRKGFIAWVKEHKTQLILTGISVTTILATALGLKNKDAIADFWNTLHMAHPNGRFCGAKRGSSAIIRFLLPMDLFL